VTPTPTTTPASAPSPASRRRHRRILFGILGGVVVIVVGLVAACFLLVKVDSPPKLSKPTGATVAPSGTLAGTWTATSGGRAGYRVREKLGDLPAPSHAVGRTSNVTGSFTITDQSGALGATTAR